MATFPSGYRSFSTSFNDNKSQPVFNYVEDPNWVWTDNAGNLNTGAWRPLFPTDFNANIDITGLTVSVGAVAVTGAPVVTLTGVQNVNVTNPVLAVSGNLSASISSVAVTGAPVVTLTGNQNVNVINPILAISGNVVVASTTISNPLSITGIPTYQKISSTGYVSTFSPLTGPNYINKIFGYSNVGLVGGVGYIQVFDGVTGGNNLLATLPVQSGNSWFMDFAENGTVFTSGITIINSSDPILNKHYSTNDLFVTIVYR
jgi:hypothetical protein